MVPILLCVGFYVFSILLERITGEIPAVAHVLFLTLVVLEVAAGEAAGRGGEAGRLMG